MERTLILIKPEAVAMDHEFLILSQVNSRHDYPCIGVKMLRATEELTRQHYAEHVEKSFFDGLLKQFVGKLVVVAVFEGPEGMIQNIRSLVGDTDPKKAKRETIREMFGTGVPDNAIHASASPDEAEREIAIWFSPKEIFPSKFGTDHDPTWV